MKGKRKKKRKGKLSLWLILIGIGLLTIFIFRQEIFNTFMPRMEKRKILREEKTVLLYFSDREEEYLVGEKREIPKRDKIDEEAKETIIELIKGPKGKLVP